MSAGLLDALLPREGRVPGGDELRQLAEAAGGPGLTEATYTWREGEFSLETVSGRADRIGRKGRGSLRLIPGGQRSYPCVLYLPEGCDLNCRKKRWPVVLFFHGIGERGDNPAALLRYGPPKYVSGGGALDAILVCPQCPGDSHWTEGEDMSRLLDLVDEVCGRLPVDRQRVYLTGLSMGARCVWRLALARPEAFAAGVMACGRTESYDFAAIRDMPLWLFHGTEDRIIPFLNAQQIVSMLYRSGHRYFKLTAYPGIAHDCWTAAFSRTDVYDWLLFLERKSNQKEL